MMCCKLNCSAATSQVISLHNQNKLDSTENLSIITAPGPPN